MYKKIIFMALIIVQWSIVNSQSISRKVIASAGGIASNSNNSISFTIGETVIGTFNSNNNILTQGFQQGDENGIAGAPIIGILKSCDFTTGNKLTINATGGTWFSSDTSIAKVSSAGIVTGISNGTVNISYLYVVNGNTYVSNIEYIVAAASPPAPIVVAGPQSVCVGSTVQLSNVTPNGVWTSIAGRATINSNGLVTGTSQGSAVIKYTVTNAQGCSNYRLQGLYVNSIPATPNIAYSPVNTVNPQLGAVGNGNGIALCKNKTFILRGSPSGGTWNSGAGITITPVNAQDVSVTTTANGNSFIKYIIENGSGCSNSRTLNANIVTCSSKGLNNQLSQTNSQFTIYPNPSHSVINLTMDKLVGTASVVVTNLFGKQVKQQLLSLGNNKVDVSTLSKGMYLVTVVTEQGKTTQKLIVE